MVMQEAIGTSENFLRFQESIARVAPIDRPVLILGERGSGKELAALRLHYMSHRWQSSLVTLNCAALNPTLVETELFGHEKGAFTGALASRRGRFEAADKGTLFLDEIGTIPPEVQEKILRAVEYGMFERVGGTESVHVDVRIIAATNANLPELVRKGRFKRDLIDRLSFEVLHVPPLRERGSDIAILAEHFAQNMSIEMGREKVAKLTPSAISKLEQYPWPGNIRELKNVVERAVYQCDGEKIEKIVFDPFRSDFQALPTSQESISGPEPVSHSESDSESDSRSLSESIPDQPPNTSTEMRVSVKDEPVDLKEAVKNLEVSLVRQALEICRFNQKQAARHLGLTYDQFRGLKRKYEPEL